MPMIISILYILFSPLTWCKNEPDRTWSLLETFDIYCRHDFLRYDTGNFLRNDIVTIRIRENQRYPRNQCAILELYIQALSSSTPQFHLSPWELSRRG